MHGDAAAAAHTDEPAEAARHVASGVAATAQVQEDRRRLVQEGLTAHQAGRLEDARLAYEDAIARGDQDPDALHLYGTLLHQMDDRERGIEFIRRAIALRPGNAMYQLNLARALMETGDFAAADKACARAQSLKPDWEPVGRLRTEILLRQEKVDDAVSAASALVEQKPHDVELVLDLVKLHQSRQDLPAILKTLESAVAHNPQVHRLWMMRGRFLLATDDRPGARHAYEQAAAIDDKDAISRLMVARLALLDTKFDEAKDLIDEALALDPSQWATATDLAQKLRIRGYRDTALEILLIIERHCPDIAQVEGEIGIALWYDGNLAEAERHIARSLELSPDNPTALSALGSVLSRQGRMIEAIDVLEKAVRIDSGNVRTRYELIHALDQTLKIDKACLWARHLLLSRAEHRREFFASCLTTLLTACDHELVFELGDLFDNLENSPREVQHSGFLAALAHTDTDAEIRRLMQIHRDWAKIQAYRTVVAPMPAIQHDKTRRKIRIGLLSSDLRGHSVVKFVSPLIGGYDHDKLELYCYSPYIGEADNVEELVRQHVDSHQRVGELSAREMVRKIREDKVDILLELNGLTRHSRLPTLVDRAAPVQMEWLGYPFTTGLEQMDYLVTDRYLRPANPDYLYESAFEMEGAWICFGATCAAKVSKTPAFARRGHITFGSFNNTYKYSPKTLDLWAEVMRRVPDSTFLVCRPGVNSVVVQSNFSKEMHRRGIDPSRLEFLDSHPQDIRYDECYNLIDISLDTAPLTGGTTTVDSLDMGVPVVSLVGPALHQRISYAVMSHVGCPELAVETPEAYIEKAVALATNQDLYLGYRYSLRRMVRRSVLCDADCFNAGFQKMADTLVERHDLR